MVNFHIFRNQSRTTQDLTWQPGSNELAGKYVSSDIAAWNKKSLFVGENTQALLFSNGKLRIPLPTGSYDLKDTLRIAGIGNVNSVDFLRWIDTSDIMLEFKIIGVPTADKITADITAHLDMKVSNPEVFHREVLKGCDSFTVQELHDLLLPEVSDVIHDLIGTRKIEEIIKKIEMRNELEVVLGETLQSEFQRQGLKISRLSSFSFFSDIWESIQDEEREVAETTIKQKYMTDMLVNLYSGALNEATNRLRHELDMKGLKSTHEIKNAQIDADEKKQLQQIKDDRDKIIHNLEMERLLREEDKRAIIRMQGDSVTRRAHDLEKMQLIHRQELEEINSRSEGKLLGESVSREIEIMKLRDEYEEAKTERRAEIELKIIKKKEELDLYLQKQEVELWKDKLKFIHDLDEQKRIKDHIRRLEQMKARWKHEYDMMKLRGQIMIDIMAQDAENAKSQKKN